MKNLWIGLVGLLSVSSFAASPQLYDLSSSQAEDIIKSFGASQAFRSVEPPSSYGRIFGFSFGVVGTYASASKLNDATPAPIQDLSFLPSADIVAGLQLPLGIAIELGGIPSTTVKDIKLQKLAGNAKWTFTDLFLGDRIPFDMAVRAGFGRNTLNYAQTVTVSGSPVSDSIEFDSRVIQTQLAFSRKFLVFEPYLGLGWVKQSSTLSNSVSSVDLYNFTTAQSFEVNKGSFWFNAGLEVRLLMLTFGAQYDSMFGNSSGSAKLGFKF